MDAIFKRETDKFVADMAESRQRIEDFGKCIELDPDLQPHKQTMAEAASDLHDAMAELGHELARPFVRLARWLSRGT